MTMVDAMCLAVGVALSLTLSFHRGPVVGGFPFWVPTPRVMLMLSLAWLFWVGAASTAVVVAARLVRYRRMPRPAEWLASLMSLTGLQAMGPLLPVDTLILSLPSGVVGTFDTFSSWRWTMAGVDAAIIGLGMALFRLFREVLPPWAKTAWLVGLAFLALAGPIATIGTDGADLLAPSDGFGPGRLSVLHRLACQLAAITPLAMILGIPAVATVIDRLGRVRWRWTEWAGTMACLLIALALSPLYRSSLPVRSIGGAAERGMVGAWLLGVGILCWFLIDRLGPTWSRWLGDQAEEPGSTPIDSSPASTLST